MNRPILVSILSALLAPSVGTAEQLTADPAIPVGSLTVQPNVVRTGTYPTLKWNITYPSVAEDLVKISPEGTLTATCDCHVDVRVLGAAVSNSVTYAPVEAQVRMDSGSWARVFYGQQKDVRSETIVWSRLMQKGQRLDFGGRYLRTSIWSPFYDTTQKGSPQSMALVNGAVLPPYLPGYDQPSLESFLRPYLGTSKQVKIGPMDVIYLFELTHKKVGNQFFGSISNALIGSEGFDMQDLCLLVTLRKA
ncbi:hypothetical protein [Luteolibacter sp. LG18]|uniref:hypothetical protein n=1 Tax=Luteolibacter sp. LG18 TaxID=2819286 RepID=UPI002B2CEAFA|nr:hypothetical protein llg_25380 [Luteolibacter sp. LG18]